MNLIAKKVGQGNIEKGLQEIDRIGIGPLGSAYSMMSAGSFEKLRLRLPQIRNATELDQAVREIEAEVTASARTTNEQKTKPKPVGKEDPRETVNRLLTRVRELEKLLEERDARIVELEAELEAVLKAVEVIRSKARR